VRYVRPTGAVLRNLVRISRATSAFAVLPHQNTAAPLNRGIEHMFSFCSWQQKKPPAQRRREVGRWDASRNSILYRAGKRTFEFSGI
jgi:hypothetical protein